MLTNDPANPAYLFVESRIGSRYDAIRRRQGRPNAAKTGGDRGSEGGAQISVARTHKRRRKRPYRK